MSGFSFAKGRQNALKCKDFSKRGCELRRLSGQDFVVFSRDQNII